MAIPQGNTPAPTAPAPTLAQIDAQLNQAVMQRAAMKDQLEGVEKQMSVLHGIAQVLRAQQADAERAAAEKAATEKASEGIPKD